MARLEFPPEIFVTGTDTGVGKTVVSAVLAAGLDGSYWKPIQSGIEEGSDTDWIREKTGLPAARLYPETYRLRRPLSPHAAAAEDGVRIDLGQIHPPAISSGYLIIEGAGGIMAPINDEQFMLDLILKLKYPVLVVARSTLGTINHTLLTLEQLRRYDVTVFGVVLNGPKNPQNRMVIEQFGNTRVIAEMEPLEKIDPLRLRQVFHVLWVDH